MPKLPVPPLFKLSRYGSDILFKKMSVFRRLRLISTFVTIAGVWYLRRAKR